MISFAYLNYTKCTSPRAPLIIISTLYTSYLGPNRESDVEIQRLALLNHGQQVNGAAVLLAQRLADCAVCSLNCCSLLCAWRA